MSILKQLNRNAAFPFRLVVSSLCLIVMLAFATEGFAQNNKAISGKVTDESGTVIIGANIRLIGNNTVGTVTGADGKYTLNVPATGTIEVSYLGYETKRVAIGSATLYNVVLQETSSMFDDVVVVAYGSQKKVNLTGAVSAVTNDELITTKSQNVQNMMTGKIPGVRVVQKTSEPGAFTNSFDIRGFGSPLMVIDGVPRGDMERMDANEIESITVLKDASAAIYGVRAANGVVLITTKKGDRSRLKVEYGMYIGFQTPAEILKPVGSVGRMTLANEKSMRNTFTNPTLKFSDEQIAPYLSGEKKSTDWYAAILKETAPQQSHNITVSGGGEKVDYFVNLGYMDQKGFFQSNALDYNRYNLRSNINAQMTKNLKLSVKLAGMLDERNGNSKDSWEIFKNLWRSVPEQGLYANNTAPYYQKPESADDNPLALIDTDATGYKKRGNKSFQSTFEGEYSIPFVKGLTLRGLFSYDTKVNDESTWNKSYTYYDYNQAADSYNGTARMSPTNLYRTYNNSYSTLWQGSLNYDNTFGSHHVSALALFEEGYSYSDNVYASRNFSIPIPYLFAGDSDKQVGSSTGVGESASQGLVGRLNYDFSSKYLAEFSFRYDGSSKFAPGHQWGFFPAASVGWRVSEESFFKKNVSFVDNLKLRASYGKMGDDSAAAYQFISGYNYPNTSGKSYDGYPTGYVFNGAYTNSLGFRSVPNENLTWYTVKTLNIGLDADMWHGLFGFTFEIFKRDRDGLLADRLSTIPGTFGSTMPQENLNSDMTKGYELELRHNNRIGDLSYNIRAQVSMTRSMTCYYETNPAGNTYDYWRNRSLDRYNDIWFGYGSAGRYTNLNQIYNSVYANSSTLPGDYIYEDWNGDGVIDGNDMYPLATKNTPKINYGLTLAADWRGIDVNMLFQGVAMANIAYGEQLSAPLMWDGNALDMFMDRWHPTDSHANPWDPSNQWQKGYHAYGASAANTDSEFMIQRGDYLRLKSLELGYTLPVRWLSSLGVKNLRVYANAYNLFTITNVKGVDPEHPNDLYGYMYPLNKTYNFGVNITF